MKLKRTAYLAPELPSLSATFVFNEILALENLGAEVHTYSVHEPKSKAHGHRAEQMAGQTAIVYSQSMTSCIKAFLINLLTHKRSSFRGITQLIGDLTKTGIISKTSLKLMYQFFHAAWLATDLRKRNIEHLHIHFAHVPTQIGMYSAALAGIPFSFTAHANDIFERPLLIKEKIKRAKKTVSISSYNIELMKQKGGNPDRMEIVRCGVDSSVPVRETGENGTHKPFRIGSLGRLVEKKGMDTLIDAARILAESYIDFKIEIAGSGPLQEKLEKQAAENGLSHKIRFLGAMPHSEVTKWMKTMDVFVLAARKDENGDMDGIPVVLMEAMNLGIPVISTHISGIPELVQHHETGLSGEPGNTENLANNLMELYNSPRMAAMQIKDAKKRIREEFDQELNARRLLKIFND